MIAGGSHLCIVTHKEEAVPFIEGFLAEHMAVPSGAALR
jgi:hypothetical protein